MARILLFLLTSLSFFTAYSQGFKITVTTDAAQYDSLHIQDFQSANQWRNIYSSPFSGKITFEDKKHLPPGLYRLSGNQTPITHFIISDYEHQHFDIIVEDQNIRFKNSPENSANMSYVSQMEIFETQIRALDREYKNFQQQNPPRHLMQSFIDTLVRKMEEVDRQKRMLQEKTIRENPGTLLASVIKASFEMPNPPQEYFQDRRKMELYYTEHFFDDFPWEDYRLLSTPIAYNKFTHFIMLLRQMEPGTANLFLTNTLTHCRKYPSAYFKLTGLLENIIGSQTSPYWSEPLYITMLKNMLEYDKTEPANRLRYTKELERLDKNHPGMQVPDVNLLLSSGDTVNLHEIEADYMLLYLQNPDCPTCIEVRDKLKNMPLLNQAIEHNKIIILTIYFEQNEALWRTYLAGSANPLYWHGWDYKNAIESNNLFDTNIIPYMFLLDKDKRVIRKDLYWDEIEDYIKHLNIAN